MCEHSVELSKSALILRIFYATDQKTSEYFRADANKILNRLRGKSYSDILLSVQSFTQNGSENPCVAGSIPVLAISLLLRINSKGLKKKD